MLSLAVAFPLARLPTLSLAATLGWMARSERVIWNELEPRRSP